MDGSRLLSVFGLFAMGVLAWSLSLSRRKVSWRPVLTGIALQIFLAVVLLKFPGSQEVFLWLNRAVEALARSSEAGTGFVFGYLGGGPLPFEETRTGQSFIFGLRALPLVLVISALSSLLFYWRIIPTIVQAFSWCLRRVMGISGVEGLGVAVNVFVGMVEAPLLVRPYLRNLPRCGLFSVMTAGMATIAGTVMVLYASILSKVIPGVMGHLLVASLISAPASVVVARLMVPEDGPPEQGKVEIPSIASSAMDAISAGTIEGIGLLVNIAAMLIVFIALVHLTNTLLGCVTTPFGMSLTLQTILGTLMAPLMVLLGIPWAEAMTAGTLMGTKTVLNEFLAYLDLAALPPEALSERSRIILTYAMCGFANFGSLGIMIGGMGAMAPERRQEIVGLGLRSIASGTLATCMTGAVVGIVY